VPKRGYASVTVKKRYYTAILQLMKYKSIASFIEEAIREKLAREGISIEQGAARDEQPRTPTQVTEVGGDWRDVR
jgi:hypothetical protein